MFLEVKQESTESLETEIGRNTSRCKTQRRIKMLKHLSISRCFQCLKQKWELNPTMVREGEDGKTRKFFSSLLLNISKDNLCF